MITIITKIITAESRVSIIFYFLHTRARRANYLTCCLKEVKCCKKNHTLPSHWTNAIVEKADSEQGFLCVSNCHCNEKAIAGTPTVSFSITPPAVLLPAWKRVASCIYDVRHYVYTHKALHTSLRRNHRGVNLDVDRRRGCAEAWGDVSV